MGTRHSAARLFALAALLFAFFHSSSSTAQGGSEVSTYIVHVYKASKPASFATHVDWYSSAIASVRSQGLNEGAEAEKAADESLVYSYDTVFHGFAARLSREQANELAKLDGILGVTPDGATAQLHTTRTPQFMGLRSSIGLWPESDFGDDVIIGVFDSGIWPEKRSFDDALLGPVPARWKGECEAGTAFNASSCNKKLIGARAYFKGYESAVGSINETVEYRSARDTEGHGTHTASTAAGNQVERASLLGSAPGTARGIATRARIAVYKVCWKGGCFNSDLLAAFEQAVSDGVDVISLSIGGGLLPYFLDPISLGSFGAMEKGILVSCSAGNGGPTPQSVTNVSPWLLTVGASTLDRDFPATVQLRNGATYRGVSLYAGKELGDHQLPLIYSGNAGVASTANLTANLCTEGSLSPALVKGKIVVCDRGINARAAKGMVVKQAGGAGMILANAESNGEELIADSHVLPATLVGYREGLAIKAYVASARRPAARISFQGTVLGVRPAPVMAAFSARGPNGANPEILKPDVTAPGVNILAAWTSYVGPTELPSDKRTVDFNIMSGTSMSCPHVSGLVALLKGAHPGWSPSAIKSALMTTAFNLDNAGHVLVDGSDSNASTPFQYGSGHVSVAALDPGLVYDMGAQEYFEDFLCTLNYSSQWLMSFSKGRYSCPSGSGTGSSTAANLNYPSMSFVYTQGPSAPKYVATLTRTVTNVGAPSSVYTVMSTPPPGVDSMKVEPATLAFSRLYEKQSFTVTCEASARPLEPGSPSSTFGSLVWSDGTHRVHSPVAFTWQPSSVI